MRALSPIRLLIKAVDSGEWAASHISGWSEWWEKFQVSNSAVLEGEMRQGLFPTAYTIEFPISVLSILYVPCNK